MIPETASREGERAAQALGQGLNHLAQSRSQSGRATQTRLRPSRWVPLLSFRWVPLLSLCAKAFIQHYPGMCGKRRRRSNWFAFWRTVIASIATLALCGDVSSAADDNPSVEGLLKTGWQIAGFSQAFDNRSTFILFRHPDELYLVQCRVGYDVTRTPSVYSICYKLR